MKNKRVAVIVGGLGSESQVSLDSGAAFSRALEKLCYDYTVVDAKEDLPVQLFNLRPDVALIALHGKYGEDGTVQGICEYLRIPYSGSGVLASALCMNKITTQQILAQNQISIPKNQIFNIRTVNESLVAQLQLPLPIVIKPAREGSSVGISIVTEPSEVTSAFDLALRYDHLILVEEFVEGMELTVPILLDRALAPIEIVPKQGFYNYKNKYTKGCTEYILPPRLKSNIVIECKKIALHCHRVLNLRAYSRVDFRVRNNNEPLVIEVNTLPGCTETSLVPKSAAFEGMAFEEFVEALITTASLDYLGLK